MWTGDTEDDEDDDPGPTNTTACVFKNNIADEGGAMYSAAGYDIVEDCSFEGNFAGTSFNFVEGHSLSPTIEAPPWRGLVLARTSNTTCLLQWSRSDR